MQEHHIITRRCLLRLLIFQSFLCMFSAVLINGRPLVGTAEGPVLGTVVNSSWVFRGIPYAMPPVGDMRWRPPAPHPGWQYNLDAADFGPGCPQSVDSSGAAWKTLNVSRTSEDCLTVNVVSPPLDSLQSVVGKTNLLPVLVFIHGGEFRYGAANDAESNWPAFLNQSAVYVTFNYRIGPFGFLAADVLRGRSQRGGTGNYGMQDQQLALKWVQQNIRSFGGDPSLVTIMGESSGGTCVAYHLVRSESFPYFQRAILQSPGLRQIKTWEHAVRNTDYLLCALALQGSPRCPLQPGQFHEFPGAQLGIDWYGEAVHVLRADKDVPLAVARRWCEEQKACAGFSVNSANSVTTFVKSSVPIVPRQSAIVGRVSRTTSYLKSGPTGQAALECLLAADANVLASFDSLPRDDTLETDGWGPVLDGVDLSMRIEESISKRMVHPTADVLLGTNADETSSTMYLMEPISCSADRPAFTKWASSMFGELHGSQLPIFYDNIATGVLPCAVDSSDDSGMTTAATNESAINARQVSTSTNADNDDTAGTDDDSDGTDDDGDGDGDEDGDGDGDSNSDDSDDDGSDGDGDAVSAAPSASKKAEANATKQGTGSTQATSVRRLFAATPGSPKPAKYWHMAAIRASSDESFLCPVTRFADVLVDRPYGGNVFKYYFKQTPNFSTNFDATGPLGAFHGADIAFVFGAKFELLSSEDRSLAHTMGCYWKRFISMGNVSSAAADDHAACNVPSWQRYSRQSSVTQELSAVLVGRALNLGRRQCTFFDSFTGVPEQASVNVTWANAQVAHASGIASWREHAHLREHGDSRKPDSPNPQGRAETIAAGLSGVVAAVMSVVAVVLLALRFLEKSERKSCATCRELTICANTETDDLWFSNENNRSHLLAADGEAGIQRLMMMPEFDAHVGLTGGHGEETAV